MGPFTAENQIQSIKAALAELAGPLDMNVSVKLWNGDQVPLAENVDGKYTIEITNPGAVSYTHLTLPTICSV